MMIRVPNLYAIIGDRRQHVEAIRTRQVDGSRVGLISFGDALGDRDELRPETVQRNEHWRESRMRGNKDVEIGIDDDKQFGLDRPGVRRLARRRADRFEGMPGIFVQHVLEQAGRQRAAEDLGVQAQIIAQRAVAGDHQRRRHAECRDDDQQRPQQGQL